MRLDESQHRFCASKASHIRLLAPAGSGKTLSLLWRCRQLFEAQPEKHQRFLIFTFTRVARDELNHRMTADERFKALRENVRIDTLNHWGYNYLRKQVNSALSLKASNRDLFLLVKHNLRSIWTNMPAISEVLSGGQWKYVDLMGVIEALKTSGFRHDAPDLIEGFLETLDWIKRCGLSRYFDANVFQPLESMGFIEVKGSPQAANKSLTHFLRFWKDACEHLWNSAIITLDDQKYWTLIALQRRYLNSYFPEPNRYHHIFVDEFQDINPLDLLLIQELVRVNRSTLTIVGDDDQAIYEWRGAVPKFILQPDEFFGVRFETHTLETNYRSPANIIFHSQKLISKNTKRVEKSVVPAILTNAEIIHTCFNTHDDVVSFILDLARDISLAGTPKGLAVLARKKSQLIPLQIVLTSEGIPFYAKEDLNVLLSDAFEDLKTILEAVATKRERRSINDIVKLFMRCCDKVRTYPMTKTDSKPLYGFLMSRRPHTFMKCLEHFLSYPGRLRGDTLDYGLPIAKVLEAETVAEAIELIQVEMAGLQKHYAKAEDDIFYKDPPFLHLADYARRYNTDFYKFVDDVDEAIASMAGASEHDTKGEMVDNDLHRSVHLMTALRAKGKEFNTVAILDANDGMWPIRLAETQAQLEQERRVFYVAVTRAQRRLLILSVKQLAGRPVELSPYLAEMGLDIS